MQNLKKFFLLILMIFLLNSCSWIKIVIEKECEKNQLSDLSLSPESSLPDREKGATKIVEKKEKPELLRYLTGKFTVNQNDEYTYIYYKDEELFEIKNDVSAFSEEELEEKPIIKEEESILKRELAKKISVKNIKLNFYIINFKNAKKEKKVLVDIKEKKSWNIDFVKSDFEKIIFWRSWKYLMYNWWKSCNWGLIYINNESLKLKKVFKNDCNYIWEYPESYKEIKSFELWNWEIKVYYVDRFWDKNIEIVSLETIK